VSAQQAQRRGSRSSGEPGSGRAPGGRACRDHRNEGWEPILGVISTRSMSAGSAGAFVAVVSRLAALAPQPPPV